MSKLTIGKPAGQKVYEGESSISVESFFSHIEGFTGNLIVQVKNGKVLLYRPTGKTQKKFTSHGLRSVAKSRK